MAQRGCTRVDRAKGQTQETVVVAVLHELLADLLGGFDGLAVRGDAAHGDGVFVDVAAGAAAVAVGDLPGVAVHLGGVAGGLVDGVAGLLLGGELGREDPAGVVSGHDLLSDRGDTYRSAEPVSKSRFMTVPPTFTGVKYSASFFSGVVTTLPLLAASMICCGTVAPYLFKALA